VRSSFCGGVVIDGTRDRTRIRRRYSSGSPFSSIPTPSPVSGCTRTCRSPALFCPPYLLLMRREQARTHVPDFAVSLESFLACAHALENELTAGLPEPIPSPVTEDMEEIDDIIRDECCRSPRSRDTTFYIRDTRIPTAVVREYVILVCGSRHALIVSVERMGTTTSSRPRRRQAMHPARTGASLRSATRAQHGCTRTTTNGILVRRSHSVRTSLNAHM
jgi:hypothetical protein